MIDEFHILQVDGISLFHIVLDEDSYAVDMPSDLFAGFSSAIVAFTSQLGAGELSKIEIQDKIYVYEKHEELITVARISTEDDEALAEHVVYLLYREFMKEYGEYVKNKDKTVRRDIFYPFADIVRKIINKCEKVAQNNPKFLENIPPSIDIDAIVELSDFSDELVNNFPEATIRMIRKFQKSLPDDVMHETMHKLGVDVGRDITAKRLNKKANNKIVMKLLSEISISKMQNNRITLTICPFCRGKETEEFDCDFVSGFIEGIYDDPNISIKEVACHAVGDKNCVFEIARKE
jgi:predicted hydrocarbon binding protein